MAVELFGQEWKKDAPPELLNVRLPDTDDRTMFIACTTYKALDDKPRYHMKLTREEMPARAVEAVGKDIIDMHGGNDKVVGKIIAAAVDAQHRLWVAAALNYNYDGNLVLSRMRSGHYWGVSWRMQGIRYLDPKDKDICVEKSLVNLSAVPNPEYEESKIYYIADDPLPVKRAKVFHALDNAVDASLTKRLKKQSKPTIPMRDTVVVDNTTLQAPAMSTTPADASAITTPTPTNATPTPVAVPEKKIEQEVAAEKKTIVETPKEPIATPAAQPQFSLPPQFSQPAPNITYNIGLPFASQNQFAVPSSVPQTSVQATQPEQTPMSTTPAPTTQEKPATTPAVPATPAAEQQQQGISSLDLNALRRDFSSDIKKTIEEALKSLIPQPAAVPTPTPTPVAVPAAVKIEEKTKSDVAAAAAVPTPGATPTARPVDQINAKAVHDAINNLGQMQDEIAQEQNKLDGLASMITNEQRLELQNNINAMKSEMVESLNTLIEAVETHQKNYNETFGTSGNPRVAGEIARMKDQVAKQQSLSKDDMRFLGFAMEFTSESSGQHRRVLEQQEQMLQAQRAAAFAQPKLQTRYAGVAALRQVFNIDPRSSDTRSVGTKRSFDNSMQGEMQPPPQQQKQMKLDPTTEFRQRSGLAWTIADRSQIKCFIPPPPAKSLQELSAEHNMAFYPVDPLPNSLWAKRLNEDPDFAPHIAQALKDAQDGVMIEQVLSADGMNRLKKLNSQSDFF